MLLFMLFVCTISNLVTANPLFFSQHQCDQNYYSQVIPIYFQQSHDFDPYLQAATEHNPVVVYPLNEAQIFNPTNHVQPPQAMTLVDHSHHGIPIVIDNSYDFSNEIPQFINNAYNLHQGELNQRTPVVDTAYNLNQGLSLVENPFYNNRAVPIRNTPGQRCHANEYFNTVVPTSSTTERKTMSSDTRKALIDTLMSNPTLKTLIDPKTKLYNQNGVEVPRHFGNDLSTPVINNYIIVPPDLINDSNCIKSNQKTKRRNFKNRNLDDRKEKERPRRRKHRKKSDSKNDSKNIDENNSLNKFKRKEEGFRPVNEVRGAKRKRKPENKTNIKEHSSTLKNAPTSFDAIENSTVNSESNNHKTTQDFVPIHDTSTTKTCLNNENVHLNQRHTDLSNYHSYNQVLNAYQNSVNGASSSIYPTNDPIRNIYQQIYGLNNNLMNKETIPQTNNKILTNAFQHSQPNTKNELHLNLGAAPKSREEEAVKEICRKFPGIPEDTVRKLIAHLKKKLLNEQGQFMYQWPFNYNHLLQPQQYNSYKTSKRNRNNTNKKSRNKSQVNNNKNQNNKAGQTKQDPVINIKETNIEQTPTIRSNATESIFVQTTKKNVASDKICEVEYNKQNKTKEEVKEVPNTVETPVIPKKAIEIQEPFKKSFIDEIIETTTTRTYTVESNEIESTNNNQPKEHVSEFYGIFDDYYPVFTDNNKALFFQNDEYAITNLETEKYHYTTDRSIGVSELSRERRKYELDYKNNNNLYEPEENKPRDNEKTEPGLIKNQDLNENGLNKSEIRKEVSHEEIMEQVHFISPPVLELPDFETKQVARINFDRDYFDFNDKGSTYSDAKSTQYNKKLKPSQSNLDHKKHDVETVFAKSRVVKYGPEESAVGNDKVLDINDRKTIVLAESMK